MTNPDRVDAMIYAFQPFPTISIAVLELVYKRAKRRLILLLILVAFVTVGGALATTYISGWLRIIIFPSCFYLGFKISDANDYRKYAKSKLELRRASLPPEKQEEYAKEPHSNVL